MEWLYALGLAYLIGSVPFGLILTRAFGTEDLRSIGSGNIGATNVLRTGRKGLAAATLLLDGAKGFLAVWLAGQHLPDCTGFAALGAVLGHCFPVWLKFKGGKGVATTMGVCLALAWPIGAAYAAVWLAVLAAGRISSLAGISAAVAAPIAALSFDQAYDVPFLAAIALLVVVLHRANIGRLLAGTEPRVGSRAPDSSGQNG